MPKMSALLFLAALSIAPYPAKASSHHTFEVEGWRVRISNDPFSGAVSCRITRKRVSVQRDWAVFQFNPNIDTSSATVRVDDGAPLSAHMPDADRLTDDIGRLENPSHGEVKIELSELGKAHNVLIRPSGVRNPQRFEVSGLADALAFAKMRNCPAG